MNIGPELRKARLKAGMSQERLSFEAGIHRTYVSLLELGKKSPTVALLVRVCKPLGVRPSALIARAERAETTGKRAPGGRNKWQ